MKVFISHSSADKPFVRLLKEGLNINGISTWVDEDQIDFGDSLINKLEAALDDSTHLLIVLSPSSVESDWVKYELDKALSNTRTGLMNKIIPIKFQECDIPEELQDIVYADLSEEVFLPDGDKIKFISNGFDKVFLKIVKAIRNTTKRIDESEKNEIIKSIKSSQEDPHEARKPLHRGIYKLIGYSTKDALQKYQGIIASNLKIKGTAIADLRPILLPPSIKNLYNPNIGQSIKILGIYPWEESIGVFAGFRKDDLSITLDRRIRNDIDLKAEDIISIEIDPEKDLIVVKESIDESPTSTFQYNSTDPDDPGIVKI